MSAVLPSLPAIATDGREVAVAPRSEPRPSVDEALARLAGSRERLRAAMLPPPKRRLGESEDAAPSFIDHLLERIKELPGVAVLIDGIESWWSRHPLHAAASVATEATRRLAEPIAERNPLLLVGGAFALGALLVVTRPWRWILRPVVFAGLVPAIAARAVRELSIDTLADIFAWYSAPPKRSAATPADSPHTPAPPAAAQTTHAAPMQH
jgi:hypothetical protein